MTARRRITATALAVAVLAGALVALFGFSPARAAEVGRVDVVLDFTGLVPGVERTVTYPVEVPVVARIVESGFISVTGVAEQIDWTIDFCGTATCLDITDGPTGAPVAPGAYTLRVRAVLTDDVTGEGEALGRVRLVAADGALPTTGSPALWAILVTAGLLVLLGLATVRAVDRRGDDRPASHHEVSG